MGDPLVFAVRCVFVGVVVALCFATVTAFDARFMDVPFLGEAPPQGGSYFLLRSVLAFTLSLLLVSEIYRFRKPGAAIGDEGRAVSGAVSSAVAAMVLAAASAAVMASDPELFFLLGQEDSLFEWTSVLLLAFGGVAMVFAAIAFLRRRRVGLVALALVVALVQFLIALEEVSWFQRVAGWQTPAWLEAMNFQGETNLHNLVTNESENAYYLGAFLLLVLTPIVYECAPPSRLMRAVGALVPSRYLVVVGSLSTAFGYEMWNVFWLQIAAYASGFILFAYLIAAARRGDRREAGLFAVASIVFVAVHAATFLFGSTLVRSWYDTEFKEMLIALGLAAYALGAATTAIRMPVAEAT